MFFFSVLLHLWHPHHTPTFIHTHTLALRSSHSRSFLSPLFLFHSFFLFLLSVSVVAAFLVFLFYISPNFYSHVHYLHMYVCIWLFIIIDNFLFFFIFYFYQLFLHPSIHPSIDSLTNHNPRFIPQFFLKKVNGILSSYLREMYYLNVSRRPLRYFPRSIRIPISTAASPHLTSLYIPCLFYIKK